MYVVRLDVAPRADNNNEQRPAVQRAAAADGAAGGAEAGGNAGRGQRVGYLMPAPRNTGAVAPDYGGMFSQSRDRLWSV